MIIRPFMLNWRDVREAVPLRCWFTFVLIGDGVLDVPFLLQSTNNVNRKNAHRAFFLL